MELRRPTSYDAKTDVSLMHMCVVQSPKPVVGIGFRNVLCPYFANVVPQPLYVLVVVMPLTL